jgi:hypothetical protein
MTIPTSRMVAACAAVVVAFGLAACGSGTATAPAAPAVSAAAPSAAAPDDTADDDSGDSSDDDDDTAAAGAKVSANTASEDEISDALEAAGVNKPERWAEEVVEYRPYPADDPNLSKLRDNLAKYNPGQGTTDKIVSALTP